ncbi:hypothetical protein WHR41_05103 [Cladosporium halotolerans]|uniref:Uncharacterized protein n=1 Tax=Cladosporium halotolerans TaxID=1052096 RepID=A0AB34KNX7_9PEZI
MSFFKNLFKESAKKDVITLFHKPSNQASVRAHTLLKQTAANATATATEDQAADHASQSKLERTEFELDVQETAPTTDQLSSILEYLGPAQAGSVISDATGTTDALKKFKANENSFKAPVTVDWMNARAVVGDNESEIMKLIRTLPKETEKV